MVLLFFVLASCLWMTWISVPLPSCVFFSGLSSLGVGDSDESSVAIGRRRSVVAMSNGFDCARAETRMFLWLGVVEVQVYKFVAVEVSV